MYSRPPTAHTGLALARIVSLVVSGVLLLCSYCCIFFSTETLRAFIYFRTIFAILLFSRARILVPDRRSTSISQSLCSHHFLVVVPSVLSSPDRCAINTVNSHSFCCYRLPVRCAPIILTSTCPRVISTSMCPGPIIS